ncbi:AAA family ATPase [Nocardiopsis sp. NPDC006139]|uniref:AAA family ATPase n=1 Tax=Nocardiopsis TaxID=2013 RepID=UPI00200F34D5|nr:AAA family ATPase [Nocardiopsis dassonvillei]MCK9871869.1 AAA family ATPase [Nocardiopsis dassonvillei]
MVSPAALRASSTSPTAPEQPRTIRPDADPRSGRFIVLEGLAAVGKSTIAPLLAAALDAELVETQLPEFTQARRYMDEQRSVNARLHFWMMANYAVSDIVREHLRTGRDVVIESYFYRTLATHAAMGARHLPEVDWGRAAAPNLAIELTLREPHRQRRLAERESGGPGHHWSELAEAGSATLRSVYDSFDLSPVDTTGLTPEQVVGTVERLLAKPHVVTLSGVSDAC